VPADGDFRWDGCISTVPPPDRFQQEIADGLERLVAFAGRALKRAIQ